MDSNLHKLPSLVSCGDDCTDNKRQLLHVVASRYKWPFFHGCHCYAVLLTRAEQRSFLSLRKPVMSKAPAKNVGARALAKGFAPAAAMKCCSSAPWFSIQGP